MARQILMACLIFNGSESGATARVLTRFALEFCRSRCCKDCPCIERHDSHTNSHAMLRLARSAEGTGVHACLHGASKNVRVR